MFLPLLTELDPAVSGEGSLDPLGLYAIADSLAVRLVPGVRERQQHPRFLTAIAVSLSVCSDFPDDALAKDGVSEPWQVFEWYLVEGTVHSLSPERRPSGLPGSDKATRAIRDGVPLSAKRYLKSPSVFGFHGVYRLLSRLLGVETAGRLGEFGYVLLSTWAEEQELKGFHGTGGGPGAAERQKLVDAIADGLRNGATARSGNWSGWRFFGEHLSHDSAGHKERQAIRDSLLNRSGGFRGDVLEFLTSLEGQRAWLDAPDGLAERRFHEALAARSDTSLGALLAAIEAYETFARLLQDAFGGCLFLMSPPGRRVSIAELAALPEVTVAAEEVPAMYSKVRQSLEPLGEAARFDEQFVSMAEHLGTKDWVTALIEHHRRTQLNKPPNGKAPWCERLDSRAYVVRQGYERDTGGRHEGQYVHAYRTGSLWSFAQDLGMVR